LIIALSGKGFLKRFTPDCGMVCEWHLVGMNKCGRGDLNPRPIPLTPQYTMT